MIKKAKYNLLSGEVLIAEYDAEAPCRVCGLAVVEASVGGTDVCPWCDMGRAGPSAETRREMLEAKP